MRVKLAVLLALAVCGNALSQLTDVDPDWKEQQVKPPANFRTDRLVPIEMPRYMSVRIGIDPDTLTVAEDGIVRYVAVATAPNGSTSASYEGIRCKTGQVKVYAFHGSERQWNVLADAEWRALSGNQRSMHALAIARQGACDGRSAAAHSAQEIISNLKKTGATDQR